eukprot:TRINITY_DN5875_c0_g1_i1.p1 TRINITY_DN5875_c0_g1~~TRINITY_DN5875_c0_g1_i1.p1  ORF type:complete len:314 (+),score=86.96 TRINITY_DN5875_c0_g1_i1:78-944(+)
MALRGTVSKWVACKGYGFIQGETGEEVFVYSGAIVGGNSLTIGTEVTYELDLAAKKRDGAAAAKNVQGPGVRGISAGQCEGVVKEWLAAKSYGFIRQNDGTVLYVHHSAFDGSKLEVNQVVRFDVTGAQHDSGRNIAINVSGPGVKQRAAEKGVVRRWNFEKRYGFIQEDKTRRDIFVHTNEVGGAALAIGKELYFDVGNKDGKEHAFNISGPAITDVAMYLNHNNKNGTAKGGANVERRRSPLNNKYYTREEFMTHFGGSKEWNNAFKTSTKGGYTNGTGSSNNRRY